MNNYNYPYYGNNYGYGVQPGFYGQQQQFYPQPVQTPIQTQKPKFMPLYFTNGLVGVQSMILEPNEKVYLLDSDNKSLYVKSADNEGRYNIETYELSKTGTPKTEYVLQGDFKAFTQRFDEGMNKLLLEIESLKNKEKNA